MGRTRHTRKRHTRRKHKRKRTRHRRRTRGGVVSGQITGLHGGAKRGGVRIVFGGRRIRMKGGDIVVGDAPPGFIDNDAQRELRQLKRKSRKHKRKRKSRKRKRRRRKH